jgi:hypothetical protein
MRALISGVSRSEASSETAEHDNVFRVMGGYNSCGQAPGDANRAGVIYMVLGKLSGPSDGTSDSCATLTSPGLYGTGALVAYMRL